MKIFNTHTCTPGEAAELFYSQLQQNEQTTKMLAKATERDPERSGGQFAFWRVNSDGLVAPVVSFLHGVVQPPEHAFKYLYFANEKSLRLSTYRGHISSWSSRDIGHQDPMQRKYGGAIRCGHNGHMILSFSGLSEEEDEFLMTQLAWRLGLLKSVDVRTIFSVSNNPLIAELLLKCMIEV